MRTRYFKGFTTNIMRNACFYLLPSFMQSVTLPPQHPPKHLQQFEVTNKSQSNNVSHAPFSWSVMSPLSLSGRLSSRGVLRRGAACCSACSTSPRLVMATWRARPRRGLAAGCVWASNAAPTWQPWMSTATRTPTLKRKEMLTERFGVSDRITCDNKQLEEETNMFCPQSTDTLKKINQTPVRLADLYFYDRTISTWLIHLPPHHNTCVWS